MLFVLFTALWYKVVVRKEQNKAKCEHVGSDFADAFEMQSDGKLSLLFSPFCWQAKAGIDANGQNRPGAGQGQADVG